VNAVLDSRSESAGWDLVAERPRTAALLHPLRVRILDSLREPDSAAGLSRRLRLSRQRVTYHVRELARALFFERAGRRRRRNMIEQRYRATAQGYILSPELLGQLGLPRPRAEDVFSESYLLGLVALAQYEIVRSTREAAAQNKRLSTLSMNAVIRLESASQRAQFTEELRHAVIGVMGRYSSSHTLADGPAG
jgi:DNA-binding transcriptional ArsR family regulator